jgi:predicted nucleic acid-binding protein
VNYFYWDASALGKRYALEPGTALVNHLFASVPATRMLALYITLGELMSILVRRHNAGVIDDMEFELATRNLRAEIVAAADFPMQSVADSLVLASLPLIERHSLNATDALILRSALDAVGELRARGDDLVLVASDLRLIAAAQAEGLLTFNPEALDQAKLEALLSA